MRLSRLRRRRHLVLTSICCQSRPLSSIVAAALARLKIAPRAAHYDETATFPAEDFADLFASGLHGSAVPKSHGGLGFGPYSGDVFTLWMMTKELAKVDLSLARCWEGHANSMVLLSGIATAAQQRRWFKGVVEDGDIWVAWSGEPQTRALDQKERVRHYGQASGRWLRGQRHKSVFE